MDAKFDVSRLQPRDVATQFEKKFSVGTYLAHQGHKFVERFDANSYVSLSMAMDLFDLGDTAEKLRAVFAPSRCRWLVISFSSDWLFPPAQSRQIVDALIAGGKPVSYCDIESSGGHDSFLLEEKLPVYGGMIGSFLDHLDQNHGLGRALEAAPATVPTSIFHDRRLDYDMILELVPSQASVLDVGCGAGVLLERLRRRGHARVVGVELDEQALLSCIRRGLDVVQADLGKGLTPFADGQFDVVLLSQTLQAVVETERILAEIVRVGRSCIVTFPNFAYHKLRTMLFEQGRSPKAEGPYHFEWYNTPNRRFPTIADFESFCEEKEIRIRRRLYLDSENGRWITEDPNWNADVGIFVLQGKS
jgi:homoserine O-acetyltransferase/O-succinyltransferase